ncbi:guanylate kinase [Goodfellowiella coeruleoviolacea]|uniref:Guanylate kinase n=1 Tax=Goodfellowiella coeruleoviolacea TaxID=334858 RepID=A0AAE3KGX4_9PSEU|nr:guanylate kinase [Goodfellowiella coeruleoviolacea]MCP2166685.1 guanylate kinase [Goodfellowiella coeruleoviolacea]
MSRTEPGLGGDARPRLTVVSGPSGVGKSSVLAEVRRRRPEVYFSVSVTTRKPRPGEVDGVHYHFVDPETFRNLADTGELLEQAEYAGNRYGTPRGPVQRALDAGRPALLEIELQGARQVRARMPEAQLVMLVPPSWDELVARLTRRGTEDPAVVARRLEVARQELAAEDEFDAVVVNTDVLTAADELVALVVGQGPGAATRPDRGPVRGASRTRRG